MSQKQYWQSFGELNDPENFKRQNQDEFREELPFEGFDDKGLVDAKAPRRDFLKYLGFSTAAATIAASCKIPVRQAVPFANKPENIVPGMAKYYATTYVQDGDAIPILAKVRDGRPIKIEGNEGCSFTKGGTTARAQASVLDLYDMHRIRFPHKKSGDKHQETTYDAIDKAIGEAIKAGPVVLLTGTINSPSTLEIIKSNPNIRHVQVDPISYSGMLLANEASGFGKKLPSYLFENASKVVVSIGADFLGTWLSPVEYAKGYSANRKLRDDHKEMSKHYQFESFLSLTGASADERFVHRPSETGKVALAILAGLDGSVTAPQLDAKLAAGVKKVVTDLQNPENKGKSLVVCGSNDVNTQIIVNAINNAIGANGTTIDWNRTVNYRAGIDTDFATLVADMEAGSVKTLLVYGANPAYNHPLKARFKAAIGKVSTTVSFGERWDETTLLCNYILPTHNYLESWGDAEIKTGYTSFIQPTIYPLFKTRAWQTSLLKWSGNNTDYETYFKNYWTGTRGLSEDVYYATLQAGVLDNNAPARPTVTNPTPMDTVAAHTPTAATNQQHQTPTPPVVSAGAGSYGGGKVAEAATAINGVAAVNGDEIVLYEKVSIGHGSGATNPWLQEFPDSISKASWDNYAIISMSMAKKLLDIDLVDGSEKSKNNYEYYPSKPMINVTIPGSKEAIKLPVLILPGMHPNVIAVAVGYGRNKELGKTAEGVGVDIYPTAAFNGTNVIYHNTAKIEDAGEKYKIAQMQIHNSYENRIEVVRETTLASFKKYPTTISDYRHKLVEDYAKNSMDFRKEATLYGVHQPEPAFKWGLNIDMNACFGCGACVVACHAENNVPVVGKAEVMRYHDMHWLRIDRYFVSSKDNADDLKGVVFQPMMCQHCDNAPCENVCPVAATNHSSEGINQMAYNRCIGTRYCANNCPFKVRRFNWADYTGADSFPDNQDQQLVGKLDPVVHQMNDDLSRMVLNPDVTVRSRGVMEKCSMCIQKIQLAKLEAKKDNRMLKDGEARTACQMACSADAIVFGNAADKHTAISIMRADANNQGRQYQVLEQLHVLPNVTYLAKIRNTDEIDVEFEKNYKKLHKGGHGGEAKKEGATEGEHKVH
ncbi:MAG TPA: TAT-variant-translocated molybdopterin oxidoreductase [Chitinophagaceae bacterium]|jgi:molybdopterin-containing oxidoreductase family iron-sulfur binding subunit|nr:TAT-variant-translocated molybdopterin oxidoreductase [Chitinophagaceae bacterium]